ncbi:DUF3987 domain-containing protein [Achromobacter denitrificans]|nr:DUF3987 domain-containing protein [Achromobacter denitrificans]
MTDDKSSEPLLEVASKHTDQLTFPDFAPEDETYPWEALPQTIKGAVIEICRNDMLSVPIAAQAVLSAVSLACQDLIWVSRGIGVDDKTVCSLFFLTVSDTGSRKSRADQQVAHLIEAYDLARRTAYEKEVAAFGFKRSELQRKIREYEKAAGQLLRKSQTLASSGKKNAEELARKASDDLVLTEEKLAELRRQESELRTPRLQRVLYSQIPIRQLERSLAENWPSAGLFSDEAAGILNSKGESDMASLDRLWDGGSIDVVGGTKQESFFVRDPRLTLSLMVQPIVFDRFLERKGELAKGIGLMSRVLLSRPDTPYGKRKFQKPELRSTVWIERFNQRVRELLQHSHASIEDRDVRRKTLCFEPDAQKFWEEVYDGVEVQMAAKGDFEDEREFANRYAEHVARLAALFHFFEYGSATGLTGTDCAIPRSTVEAADKVVRWYLNEFRRVFNQEARMREMAEYILAKLKSMLENKNGGSLDHLPNGARIFSVPVQDLRANCSKYGLKKIENFRPVLDWLHARGNVVIREAERRSSKDLPNRPKLAPESVEIRFRALADRYEFFFDLDNRWLAPRSR